MPDGDMTPDGDESLTPVTEETTDEHGNTVIIGYPSGSNQGYVGTPITDPNVGGVGVGGSESEGA